MNFPADFGLREFIASCKTENRVRLAKIVVENEQLKLALEKPIAGTLKDDYCREIPGVLDENIPCFLLIRLETASSLGDDWLLITYSPDTAPVRHKMLLAATQKTLKTEFGASYIKHEIHAPSKEDAAFDAFLSHTSSSNGENDIDSALENTHLNDDTSKQRMNHSGPSNTLRGVAFPIDSQAIDQLKAFQENRINYVQLSVNTSDEQIQIEKRDQIEPGQLETVIPDSKPRYHFYRYSHSHQGQPTDTILFLYSMPSSGTSIKDRMLYSSCKGPFLQTVQGHLGLDPFKKLELDSSDRVTEQYLLDEIYPKEAAARQTKTFSKPKGPPGRGNRRIIKPTTTQ